MLPMLTTYLLIAVFKAKLLHNQGKMYIFSKTELFFAVYRLFVIVQTQELLETSKKVLGMFPKGAGPMYQTIYLTVVV